MQTKSTRYKIQDLVNLGIIEKPSDGNHGEIHPKGDDFVSAGIPFIMSSDINNGLIDFENCKFISEVQAKTLRKGFSVTGDVLLTHKASIGRTAIVPQIDTDYILLTPQVTYYRIKDNGRLNNGFLKYYFDSKPFQSVLAAYSGAGSTRAYIGITEQLNLPISLPDINIQQKIASVLSALDAKIELNNRINAELEAMAKTLYDYWFVQFDFPDVNGKPYKTSGGKMVWNEQLNREIPEGWEVTSLGIHTNITTGKLDSNAEVPGGRYSFYTCAAEPTTTDSFAFDENAILVAGNNASGNFHINRHKGKFNAYQRTYVITANNSNELEYIYQVLKIETKNLKSQGRGSQTKFLTIGLLTGINIFDKTEIMEEYHKLANPIYEQQVNIKSQNQHLSSLRDWLLPMLMNGQVTVGTKEKAVYKAEEELGMAAEPGGEK